MDRNSGGVEEILCKPTSITPIDVAMGLVSDQHGDRVAVHRIDGQRAGAPSARRPLIERFVESDSPFRAGNLASTGPPLQPVKRAAIEESVVRNRLGTMSKAQVSTLCLFPHIYSEQAGLCSIGRCWEAADCRS
jgi:hypothetical protein